VLLLFALADVALPAPAADACLDFKWDVSAERALFAGSPVALPAGTDPKAAPVVVPNRLYALRLAAQDHVTFAVPPAKKPASSTAYAGLATLNIPVPGSYRIAVDLPSLDRRGLERHLDRGRGLSGTTRMQRAA